MGKTSGKSALASTTLTTKNELLLEKINRLEEMNLRLIKERGIQEKKISSLERQMHKIGDAAEQRDWLLDELTKKISTIGEIRSDLLKRERLSAIGELSSRLAHDMRNPLSIILNTIDLIKLKHGDNIPTELLKLFLMIDRATSRMTFQLDEVLNFVRNAPLEYENKSILEIIESSLYRIVIPDTVTISTSQNDVELVCDPRKLEAIFTNLIMNGIQAMKNSGHIQIRVAQDDQNVYVEVQDSGPGIPQKILDKVFDPLFTTKSRGTGLGLATVKNVVEQHHGKVEVRLNPTVFCIALPKYQESAIKNESK